MAHVKVRIQLSDEKMLDYGRVHLSWRGGGGCPEPRTRTPREILAGGEQSASTQAALRRQITQIETLSIPPFCHNAASCVLCAISIPEGSVTCTWLKLLYVSVLMSRFYFFLRILKRRVQLRGESVGSTSGVGVWFRSPYLCVCTCVYVCACVCTCIRTLMDGKVPPEHWASWDWCQAHRDPVLDMKIDCKDMHTSYKL